MALVAGIVCLGSCSDRAARAAGRIPLAERVNRLLGRPPSGEMRSAPINTITYARTGEMTATQFVQARSPTLKYMAYTIDTIQEQENQAQVTVKVQYRMDRSRHG